MLTNFGSFTPIQSMAALPSTKTPSFDLLQNCDLPPPVKVFSGPDRTAKLYGLIGQEEDDKLGLLTALQLSRTRAREAERRVEGFAKERDCLSNAVLRESLRVMAYRNWVRVLECQVSVLKLTLKQQEANERETWLLVKKREEEGGGDWAFCWAIPLGIAGIGFAFALRFLF